MFCKYCGKEIVDDSVFCKYCGANLKLSNNNTAEENKPNIQAEENNQTNYIAREKIKHNQDKTNKILGVIVVALIFISVALATYNNSGTKNVDNPLNHNTKITETKLKNDKYLNIAYKNYEDIQNLKKEYLMSFWYKNQKDKEKEFLAIYNVYTENLAKFSNLFYESDKFQNDKYVNENKETYKRLGINLIQTEECYSVMPEYNNLVDTFGIPKNWKEWLLLKQKYINKQGELSINQIEEGIIKFETIEKNQQS